MYIRGTQGTDSVKKSKIQFEFLAGSTISYEKPSEITNIPSPVAKRKREVSTRPTKKIKFLGKTNYNFIDTQAQITTPFSSSKITHSNALGALGSSFAAFLSQKSPNHIICKILKCKTVYGCNLAKVEVIQSNVDKIAGRMDMICNQHINVGGIVTVIDPKIIQTGKSLLLVPKEIC